MGCFLALSTGSTVVCLAGKQFRNNFFNWCPPKNFSPFCSASPEIIENRQIDKQTNILHQCVFFLSVKFATSLLTLLEWDNISLVYFNVVQLQRLCLLLFIQADTIADMHKKSKFAFSAKQNFASFANSNISIKLNLKSKTFLFGRHEHCLRSFVLF